MSFITYVIFFWKGEAFYLLTICSGVIFFQWDEALLTMSSGEKVELTIEPEWAYGRKGMPDVGYPLFDKICIKSLSFF